MANNPGRYILTPKGKKVAILNKHIKEDGKRAVGYLVDDNFEIIKGALGVVVNLENCKVIGFFD